MSALSLKKKFLMTSFTFRQRLPRTSGLFASFSFQGALRPFECLSRLTWIFQLVNLSLLIPFRSYAYALCGPASRGDRCYNTIFPLPCQRLFTRNFTVYQNRFIQHAQFGEENEYRATATWRENLRYKGIDQERTAMAREVLHGI